MAMPFGYWGSCTAASVTYAVFLAELSAEKDRYECVRSSPARHNHAAPQYNCCYTKRVNNSRSARQSLKVIPQPGEIAPPHANTRVQRRPQAAQPDTIIKIKWAPHDNHNGLCWQDDAPTSRWLTSISHPHDRQALAAQSAAPDSAA